MTCNVKALILFEVYIYSFHCGLIAFKISVVSSRTRRHLSAVIVTFVKRILMNQFVINILRIAELKTFICNLANVRD